jgi:type IV secretion system protein VirB3
MSATREPILRSTKRDTPRPERITGLVFDVVFVGATRPPMRWGVTYSALLCNMVFTLEAFLLTKNLLTLSVCVPIHGVCMLLCARDARFFDLALLWARTRLPAVFGNLTLWRASSYSPLLLDLPDHRGRRPCRDAIAELPAPAPMPASDETWARGAS